MRFAASPTRETRLELKLSLPPSKDPSVSVLLLEAGGDGTKVSNVPMFLGLNLNGEIDWSYKTRPDGRTCLGMVGKQCSWHRGKAVGGSSNINTMIYMRGDE
jgi:choline dehydrogenase